jgi:hypothetical protein
VANVTDMTTMFSGTALSTVNYDALLNGWNALPSLQSSVVFSAGSTKYSAAAAAARAAIISTYGWTITDGGPA